MAYFSQEMKKAMAPKIKAIAAKYGLKVTISVYHHSEVVLNIKAGKIDFIGNYNKVAETRFIFGEQAKPVKDSISVNTHWMDQVFDGEAIEALNEFRNVLYEGNWDKSDIQTDYFNVGWYVSMNVGNWEKPYVIVA